MNKNWEEKLDWKPDFVVNDEWVIDVYNIHTLQHYHTARITRDDLEAMYKDDLFAARSISALLAAIVSAGALLMAATVYYVLYLG